MRRFSLSAIGLLLILSASAQLSIVVGGNYTMYKADFNRNTSGVQLRAGYSFEEKTTLVLGFTYGLPIKETGMETVYANDGSGGAMAVPAQVNYNFRTFNLTGHYAFVGDAESAGKFYGMAGVGLVMVNYKEEITGSYDKNTYSPQDMVNGHANGMTINLGLGGSYKVGRPAVFGEAGLALPSNRVGYTYVENVIPLHFYVNLGVMFGLGANE